MSMQLKVNEKEYTVTYGFRAMYESEFIKEMFNTFENICIFSSKEYKYVASRITRRAFARI